MGKKKVVWICILSAILVLLICAGIYFYRLTNNQEQLFTRPTPTPTVSSALPQPTDAPPTPAPTLSPYDELVLTADKSLMDGIVNIMLIGVDYAPERETWGGKHAYHSDVMIVLAANFKENKVDLISLPRDTYANIPGVRGIYKLNASIDCGGGYPDGLSKVAQAASWMLGGIPVDYYYAVTMPVLKEIVDVVGGIEFDVDVAFTMAGRRYKKGLQHMDGQAVLDYVRVRKNVQEAGDLNRINRQKEMLLAVFNTMKEKDLLVQLPDLLKAFEGKLMTNTSIEQTAALALFGFGLPSENITMRSMDGSMRNIFNWNFCLTNQKKRVQIIKDVYGLDMPQYKEYTSDYALKQWADMRKDKYFKNAESVLSAARNHPGAFTFAMSGSISGDPLPTFPPETPPVLPPEATVPPITAPPTPPPIFPPETGTPPPVPPDPGPSPIAKKISSVEALLSSARRALEKGSGKEMDDALASLSEGCDALAAMIGIKKPNWFVTYENEIEVDFR